ncbi:MOXD1 homolog 2-like isoform X3 [Bradysia coprophila]|nr:MOXD1 homolog 2-like isoform X3 [Bradysia coprophila]
MRFKRKLDTCDTSHDIRVTNDTMRVVYMYHQDDPLSGSVIPGSLPNPQLAFKGYIPLSLLQRAHDEQKSFEMANKVHSIELRNEDVTLPEFDETLHWCNVFDLNDIRQKQHIIKFEPVFESPSSKQYLQQIILYECQGKSSTLEAMSRERGHHCNNRNNPNIPCNAVVAVWTKGSDGFTFPPEVGYPLDSSKERFYLMETHYYNPNIPKDLEMLHMGPIADNSGIKLYYTQTLRKHDAGVLSIGMDPNWRHIIPPGHEKVISEGHCVDDCTRKSFPPQGLSIFAVIMQTHNSIGKEVKLRQIRKHEELLPIAFDGNLHAGYAEYRKISPPAKIYPGDRIVMECQYDSSDRESITLGGLTPREEGCNAFVVYYPRQKKLTTCHSLPSLPTVLHSLGIEEIAMYVRCRISHLAFVVLNRSCFLIYRDSNPVLIASPTELAGMTLESRLISYDWENQFDKFQKVTRSGSFRPICLDARNNVLTGTDNIERFSSSPTKFWRAPAATICSTRISSTSSHTTTAHDSKNIYVTEMVTRKKGVDDIEVESMSLSNSTSRTQTLFVLLLLQVISFGFVVT